MPKALCPAPEQLRQLLLNQLTDPQAEALKQHLRTCKTCTRAAEEMRLADPRKGGLREGTAPGGTLVEQGDAPAVERTLQEEGSAPRGGAAAEPSASEVDAPAGSGYDFLAPAQGPDELGRLGKYRVLRVLGQGGMGLVLQAEDPVVGRLCALKVMLPEVACKPVMKERFLREARAAAKVEHDHIIPIWDVSEDRGVPYIAMPFLKGLSLADWLKKHPGPLKVPQILKLGREIARGLAAAHDHGLIHRDIKPANIWLDASAGGRVKILDFGLARLSQAAGEENLTQSGAILGTPAYMAPEQARGEQVDARADLFSLGVVLYRLCTGVAPFKGNDPVSTLVSIAMDQPQPPRALNPEIPPALSELVMKLLAKDRAGRPGSAQEVVKAIQAMDRPLAGTEDTVMTPAEPAPKAEETARRRRRVLPPVFAAALAFVAVGVAAAILYLVTPQDGTVRIEIDDPDVQVAFDKDGPTRSGIDKHEVKMTAGEHDLHVKRGDLELDTDKFMVPKGETIALRVEWIKEEGKLQVRQGDKTIGARSVPLPPSDFALQFQPGNQVAVSSLALDRSAPLTLEGYFTPHQDRYPGSEKDTPVKAAIVLGVKFQMTLHIREDTNSWSIGGVTAKGPFFANAPFPIVKDRRTHVAGVRLGKEFQLYVDGKLVAKRDVVEPVVEPMNPFTLGGNVFAGLIDEVRVSRVARYDKDFTPQKRFEPDKDTLALYHFDEGAGVVLKDSTRNRHDGQIVAGKWVKADGSPIALAPIPFGEPLSPLALVSRPPSIPGVQSWSIEPRNHRGPITAVAYSADSRRLASGGEDGTVRLWDPKAGQLQRILLGHASKITFLAWSPDGKTLASGSQDNTLRLWNADTGKLRHVLAKHTSPIRNAVWSPDGKILASFSADKLVRLWDGGSGELQRTFDVHKDPIITVGWLSDKLLVSASQGGAVRTLWVWEAGSGKTLHSYETKDSLWSWSANPKLLASKSGDNVVTFWDAVTNQTRTLTLKDTQGPIGSLAVSPDGKLLATGGENVVQLWDPVSGQVLQTGSAEGNVVVFSPDGKTLASGGPDHHNAVCLWQAGPDRKADPVKPFRVVVGSGLAWLRWSPDSTTVFTRNREGEVATFLDAASGKQLHTLTTHRPWVDDVAWSPDGKRLAVNHPDGKVGLWETDPGKFLRTFGRATDLYHHLDWSPDGATVATTGNNDVFLWDAQNGESGKTLKGLSKGVTAVVWSPDSKKLATSSGDWEDAKVRLWDDVTMGTPIKTLPTVAMSNHGLAWSSDSQILATGSNTGLVKLWDVKTGQQVPMVLKGHKQPYIGAVAWSPDGKILASGDTGGAIWLWNPKTGGSFKDFEGHTGPVHALAWLADSKTLVSLGEKDGTVRFWKVDENQPVIVTPGLPGQGRFSPDRKLLVSRLDPSRVQIWETETGRLRGTLLRSEGKPEQYLAISADGDYRIVPEGGQQLVYVVQTEAGQEALSPKEFERKYHRKNDPDKVRLVSPQ